MQVRNPIYRSSVGRPRPSRALLLPLLEALGLGDAGSPDVAATVPRVRA
jgi:hypothetical protein